MADRVFLDANVLFSAAYGSAGIRRIWDRARAGRCTLLATAYVAEEARRNLADEQKDALTALLQEVVQVPDVPPDVPCPIDLPPKDRPVFLAARAAQATHLLTGDATHFGRWFGTTVSGATILRPVQYLGTA